MNADLSILVALAAGILSFLSPCVLPLIPSYLSFVSGVSFVDLGSAGTIRWRVFSRTVFFVLGFSIVFVVLGLLFAGPALLFSGAGRWINLTAGAIVVVLGVNVMFDLISFLNLERRMHTANRPAGYLGATVVGMAFGAGWSPCIGPILASILLLAGTQGEIGRAATLLAVYSLGLGLPFLAAGAAFTRVSRSLNRLKPYFGAIRAASGAFLVVIGLLIMAGRFQQLNGWLLSTAMSLDTWAAARPAAARIVFGAIPIALAAVGPLIRAATGRRVRPGRVGAAMAAAAVLLGIAGLTGLVSLPSLVVEWLQFQGV